MIPRDDRWAGRRPVAPSDPWALPGRPPPPPVRPSPVPVPVPTGYRPPLPGAPLGDRPRPPWAPPREPARHGSGIPAVLLSISGLALDLACATLLLRLVGPEAEGTDGYVLVGALAMVWVPLALIAVAVALALTLAGMGVGAGAVLRARRRPEPALEVLLGSLSIACGVGGILALAQLSSLGFW